MSKFTSWCLRVKLEINPKWQAVTHERAWNSFGDFMCLMSDIDLSRDGKQAVWKIDFSHKESDYCFYLKKKNILSFRQLFKILRRPKKTLLASTRENQLLKLCREHSIPVMSTVAWGERRFFIWPISGFILVDCVTGLEFSETYMTSSAKQQRRMMYCYGALVGAMHRLGINSKVRPRDIICQNENFAHHEGSLVLIDREHGKTSLMNIDEKLVTKQTIDVWQKNAVRLNYPKPDKILCYWSGYSSERPDYREFLNTHKDLITRTFSGLKPQPDREKFNETYGNWLRQ